MSKAGTKEAFSMENETTSIDQPVSEVVRRDGEGGFKFFLRRIFVHKNIEKMIDTTKNTGMKRNLNVFHLMFIGIGCVIGTGIFVLPGIVAAKNAGPAVVLCFAIAGFVATLAALCYSEIAAMIPVAGSAYSYTYATMGEFIAWIVGWALVLEYMVGTAAVAVGWSGYLVQFLEDAFGLVLDAKTTDAPVKFLEAQGEFVLTGNYLNIPAIIIIALCTGILVLSSRESATATAVACMIKIAVILLFIFACASHVDMNHFVPFVPAEVDGVQGHFGIMGVLKGASIVFFCYTGFDSISTAAQEAKNPDRDLPISIVGSLLVCTALYICVCIVMVGIAPFEVLDVKMPIVVAIGYTDMHWLKISVGLSAVFGMLTAVIVTMMAQARIFFAMSRDGLLPRIIGKVHPRFGTPYVSQIMVGTIASILAGVLPIDLLATLSGMGTLFGFFIVCLGVMILRIRRPDARRPFKVPLGPYVIPLLGAIFSIGLVFTSSPDAIARVFIWIAIGIVFYFLYGFRNSRLTHPEKYVGKDFDVIVSDH